MKPIATVTNNNQPGWENIVETQPNVTLDIGTELFLYDSVLEEIANERERQDEKWDGPLNDDPMCPLDWHEMIADYNSWARRMAAMRSPEKARRRYIQVAALAVAAIESLDRKVERDSMMRNGMGK